MICEAVQLCFKKEGPLGQNKIIAPKAKDLEFDFNFQTESVCYVCRHKHCCKIAGLLNIPVKRCRYFC